MGTSEVGLTDPATTPFARPIEIKKCPVSAVFVPADWFVAKLPGVLTSIPFANQTTLPVEAGVATRCAKCLVRIRDRRGQLGTAVAAIMMDLGVLISGHVVLFLVLISRRKGPNKKAARRSSCV
jgi:hypothetical protein